MAVPPQFDPRLMQVLIKHEINPEIAPRLEALRRFEIVVICDDSGSMVTRIPNTNRTRWDELKQLVSIIIDICAIMDTNGVDIYFLNRAPILRVTDTQNIPAIFNIPPMGPTPLVRVLNEVLEAKRSQSREKKLLILIATDGAPTNEFREPDHYQLENLLRNGRTPNMFVTFLACTDDNNALEYLSGWDTTIPNLDLVDDYRSETMKVQKLYGPNFPFTFGDYIVKALLGSTERVLDKLGEMYF